MKCKLLNIGKILLSLATLPLWFVDMFKGVGHLPNQATGEIVEVVFWHSMFENIFHPALAYFSMAVSVVSFALNIAALKHSKIQTASNIIFGLACGIFIVFLLVASSVGRGY